MTLLLICVVCTIVGGLIGDRSGHKYSGALLGFLLGPLGVLLALLLPSWRRADR